MQKCDAMAHNPEKLEKRIEYLEKVKIMIKNYSSDNIFKMNFHLFLWTK